jgi:hypothetical protein
MSIQSVKSYLTAKKYDDAKLRFSDFRKNLAENGRRRTSDMESLFYLPISWGPRIMQFQYAFATRSETAKKTFEQKVLKTQIGEYYRDLLGWN